MVVKGKPGVIGIPADLSLETIDKLLVLFVTEHRVEDCLGQPIKLHEQDVLKAKKRK